MSVFSEGDREIAFFVYKSLLELAKDVLLDCVA
jgi:hypothetical protein